VIIVLLGPPGGGKGTQSLGTVHLSTGDLLRQNLQQRTPLGLEADGYMKRGALVPDATVIGMVRERLAQPDAAAGVVLDGFPRTLTQAEELDLLIESLALPQARAVLLEVPRAALMRRLTGRRVCRAQGHPYHVEFNRPKRAGVCDIDGSELYQRSDDAPETVNHRLDVYETDTGPVIGYYRGTGRLTVIDGDGSPAAVGERLKAAVAAMPRP
jgi:adenylate kinase